jgi:alpha-glucosidase
VLAFDRTPDSDGAPATGVDGVPARVRCVANLSAEPVQLPPDAEVLLTSGPLTGDHLPPDTTAWLRV